MNWISATGFSPWAAMAMAHAGDQSLGQRRVEHALRAEALLQAAGGAEHAAVDADILAEHDDVAIVLQFPGLREIDRLHHAHHRHGITADR